MVRVGGLTYTSILTPRTACKRISDLEVRGKKLAPTRPTRSPAGPASSRNRTVRSKSGDIMTEVPAQQKLCALANPMY